MDGNNLSHIKQPRYALLCVFFFSLSNREEKTLTFLGTKGKGFLYEKYSLVIKYKCLIVLILKVCAY